MLDVFRGQLTNVVCHKVGRVTEVRDVARCVKCWIHRHSFFVVSEAQSFFFLLGQARRLFISFLSSMYKGLAAFSGEVMPRRHIFEVTFSTSSHAKRPSLPAYFLPFILGLSSTQSSKFPRILALDISTKMFPSRTRVG